MPRPHLTYANVTATLALCIALGGTAYAGLRVTGREVVNGSLSGRDVRDHSLRNRDLAAGARTRGPAGPAGPAGRAGATTVVVRTAGGTSVARACVPDPTCNSRELPAAVGCHPGERATGGGVTALTGSGNAAVTDSRPIEGPGGVPVGWQGAVGSTEAPDAVFTGQVAVYAICASP